MLRDKVRGAVGAIEIALIIVVLAVAGLVVWRVMSADEKEATEEATAEETTNEEAIDETANDNEPTIPEGWIAVEEEEYGFKYYRPATISDKVVVETGTTKSPIGEFYRDDTGGGCITYNMGTDSFATGNIGAEPSFCDIERDITSESSTASGIELFTYHDGDGENIFRKFYFLDGSENVIGLTFRYAGVYRNADTTDWIELTEDEGRAINSLIDQMALTISLL